MHHVLMHLLGLKRPHGSAEEGSVIPFLIRELPVRYPMHVDEVGNLHVDARGACAEHRTLFVAHVDTVHWRGGKNSYRIDQAGNIHASGDALGADDAAGVAVLCHMIAKGVPGYYLFTRGEECGGIGSSHVASTNPDLLLEFDRAVAFDRRGTTDVVYQQRGQRTCSTGFADALSDALNDAGLLTMPAPGVYTDTAEFVDYIPECTNISAGYYREHSDAEWLDMAHWRALCAAACEVAWDLLPTDRAGYDPEYDDPEVQADAEFKAWLVSQNLTDDGQRPFDPFVD